MNGLNIQFCINIFLFKLFCHSIMRDYKILRVGNYLLFTILAAERCFQALNDYLSDPAGITMYKDFIFNQEIPQ